MAATQNDVDRFVSAIATHSTQLLKLAEEAKSLRDFATKMDLSNAVATDPDMSVTPPQTEDDVVDYLTLCKELGDFLDNTAVPALDRRKTSITMGREPIL